MHVNSAPKLHIGSNEMAECQSSNKEEKPAQRDSICHQTMKKRHLYFFGCPLVTHSEANYYAGQLYEWGLDFIPTGGY